jgi:transcriptional regulator with XRE-family HTH domain
LGLALKRLREAKGESQAQAGKAIGRSGPRISHVETGRGSLKAEELVALLEHYAVGPAERETLLALGVETRRRQRKRAYTDLLPDSFQRYSDLHADAEVIRWYEDGIIPGLLQSPDYVRAVIRIGDDVWWDASAEYVEQRVFFRQEIQRRVLDAEKPKQLDFVFTEDALHRVVGGASVSRGQVLHMLQLLEKQSNLRIQVLPDDVVDNPALGGGLVVLDFAGAAPRIGLATALYGASTYYDDNDDTATMFRAFRRIQDLSLSPEETRSLLIARLTED